jgi:hypothetical protein
MESVTGKKVMVEKRLDGKMEIMHGNKPVSYRKIEARPEKPKAEPRFWVRKTKTPAANHPWRIGDAKRLDLRKQLKQSASLTLP